MYKIFCTSLSGQALLFYCSFSIPVGTVIYYDGIRYEVEED